MTCHQYCLPKSNRNKNQFYNMTSRITNEDSENSDAEIEYDAQRRLEKWQIGRRNLP